MSKLDDLADSYEANVSAPWQRNIAGAQRVIFIVYPKEDERRLRAKLKEFQHRTVSAEKRWLEVDITDAFPRWMANQDYREEYFKFPEDLILKLDNEFADDCAQQIGKVLARAGVDTVVAIYGVSALFGFTRLHHIIQKIENQIPGRLVVFFPGVFDQNTYRLLDARDGYNYLATLITA